MKNFISFMKWAANKDKQTILEKLNTVDRQLLPMALHGIVNNETITDILIYRQLHGTSIYKFCNDLTDENFSFERFELYQQYRVEKKTDSYSETYYQLKYGVAWENYYNSRKANRPNPYDIEYQKSTGLDHAAAIDKISALKKKTSQNINTYIEKYGVIEGTLKFNKVCRRHKNYLDYWIAQCDDQAEAEQLFAEYKRKSSVKCVEFYLKNSYTKEEAAELISKNQLSTAGVHRTFYENKGYTEEEITNILQKINSKKDSASIAFIKKTYPNEDSLLFYEKYNSVKSSRFREIGYLAKDDPSAALRKKYYSSVRYYTNIAKKNMIDCPGVRGKVAGCYHIDHVFSIDAGFKNNVDPKIIGSVTNLQWLLCEINTSKRQRCDTTIEELLKNYKEYENRKN